jgi:hypothetical protein
VRLERLARGHVVAGVAALVLLLVMAMDWYGSHAADQARQATSGIYTSGGEGGQVGRQAKQEAQAIIAHDQKNAWQEPRTIDRVLLALLLLSVFVPLYAAAHRAAGRRSTPPWTPSAFAALVSAAAALLLAYRIINQPGDNAGTTVKVGAPLALVILAVIGLGAAAAFKGEVDWVEMRRTASGEHDVPPAADAQPN